MSDPNVHTVEEDDSQNSSQSESQEAVLNEVSRRLREARIALGLSEQQVAGKLFLNPLRIIQIDEGKFEKIGKPAFVKGYIRSYAREVGLSGDEIIALLNEQENKPEVFEERLSRVSENRSYSINSTPAAATAIIGIVGVVFVLLVIWWLNPDEEMQPGSMPRVGEIQADSQQNEGQPGDSISAESNEFDAITNAEQQAEGATSDQASSAASMVDSGELLDETVAGSENKSSEVKKVDEGLTSLTPDKLSAPSAPESRVAADDAAEGSINGVQINRYDEDGWRVVNVVADGKDHLHFTFTDDCWLEVVDGQGKPVYGDLNHERELLNVYGRAPFKVLIGRVSAVSVQFNNKPVNLQAYAFNDTAKLVIE